MKISDSTVSACLTALHRARVVLLAKATRTEEEEVRTIGLVASAYDALSQERAEQDLPWHEHPTPGAGERFARGMSAVRHPWAS